METCTLHKRQRMNARRRRRGSFVSNVRCMEDILSYIYIYVLCLLASPCRSTSDHMFGDSVEKIGFVFIFWLGSSINSLTLMETETHVFFMCMFSTPKTTTTKTHHTQPRDDRTMPLVQKKSIRAREKKRFIRDRTTHMLYVCVWCVPLYIYIYVYEKSISFIWLRWSMACRYLIAMITTYCCFLSHSVSALSA